MRTIQFSGLYQFQVLKDEYEIDIENVHKKHGKSLPQSLAHHRVWQQLDRNSHISKPLSPLKAAKETMIDGQPGYEGALITGKDIQAFWISQFPDVFTPERFDEYRKRAQDDTEKLHESNANQQALKDLVKITHEARRSMLLNLPGMNKGMKNRLFSLLFPDIAPEFEERREKKPGLDEAAQRSFKTVSSFEKDLRADAERLKAENPEQFEESIFNYVAQHPMDADNQPRHTHRFNPNEDDLRL